MGIKMSEAFAGKYLTAKELEGKTYRLTIASCSYQDVGTEDAPEQKPVLFFVGAKKGIVVNKTNAGNISNGFGDDSDGWIGKQVDVRPIMTSYKGGTLGIQMMPVSAPIVGMPGAVAPPIAPLAPAYDPHTVRNPAQVMDNLGRDPLDGPDDSIPF